MEFFSDSKKDFVNWSKSRDDLPLWHSPWWLDAIVGTGQWDVAICKRSEEILGYHIYVESNRFGLKSLVQPVLTQYLGPSITVLADSGYSTTHKILTGLQAALPKANYYSMNWSPEVQNWLPFYWSGYSQTTRYTYHLDLRQEEESLLRGLSKTTLREISYAKNRHGIYVDTKAELDELWSLVEYTFTRQNVSVPFNKETIGKLLDLREGNARVFVSRSSTGKPLAVAITLSSASTSHYLVGGAGPDVQNTGAMKMCLWSAILDSRKSGNSVFDFEGSMKPGIEAFFRSFGARQVPYFRVWKYSPKALELLTTVRRFIRS